MADSVIAPGRYRLWIQGLCWLLLLGPLFFLSYGQVNHFTATRADVGSLVFSWEHAIPFIPWTIVPYWSIDLLYGLSLFICTSQRELTRHAWRLLAASLVACVGFLLFPLRFTFSRPESPGIFGWLFHQLEQFDLPYNQAPSLHIILAWLLWLRFRQHVTGPMRWLVGGGFWLIAVSVMTTWQHHFIDVLTGIAAGIAISYAIPMSGSWRWQRPSSHARRLAARYAAAALLLGLIAWAMPYCAVLLWPAAALLMVATGYGGLGTRVFQKTPEGQISLSARWLLLPYLVGARLSKRWFSRRLPASSPISGGVSLGGFPDKASPQAAVLDLTAEFHHRPEPETVWHSCPMMDLLVPEIADLQHAVDRLNLLRQSQDTLRVCCALGLSRSATVVAAWLLTEKHADSVEAAVAMIRSQRPQVVLTPDHLRLLEQFKEAQCPTSV
ncbi:phosphatase PAP2/dual specificity phosphatase family protein [Erwinia sp. S43]|uniref:phosphatase PAP2/dual specificity phosphatase family protein n=1 Tax=Erwinia sp. S43 TaxID=2769339 RepID=UPI00190CA3D4|nr:phosphatase PAP2/dual specificity phosphatase family protein [Erwinia sp. S43]MBK0034780.1 phosphatase PAP2/dual specificity phosphatase family protein [Erwinia sp. S43]